MIAQWVGLELNRSANQRLVATRILLMSSMRFLASLLMLPVLVSCQSTSIEDEFAEFEPKESSFHESAEAKAMKTFASYDPEKKSSFEGKKFEGKEATLRSRYESKDAFKKDAFKEHPYFKLHDNKSMANKVYNKTEAREGDLASPYQGKEDGSWFKRAFTKKSTRDRENQVAREGARLADGGKDWKGDRSQYEGKEFYRKFEPMNDDNQSKKLNRSQLRALLNTR